MDLYNEIFRRKSTRKFSCNSLDERTVEKIKGRMLSLPQLEMSCGIEMHFVTDGIETSSKFSLSGRVHAPHYIMITGSPEEACQISAGYSTQYLVLYLTGLGIATTYMGRSIDRMTATRILGSEVADDVITVLALGNALNARDVYRRPDEFVREPLEALILEGRPTPDQRRIMEAAIAAPSYRNSQPWRFIAEGDRIQLMRDRIPVLKRIITDTTSFFDFGAALAHLEIAAKQFGYECEIFFDEQMAQDPEYIQTLKLIKKQEEQ